MILEAGELDCAAEVIPIVAALSIQDPRERPAEQRAQADQRTRASPTRPPTSSPTSTCGATCASSSARCRAASSASAARPSTCTTCACASGRTSPASCGARPRRSASALNQQPAEPADVHRALLSGLLSHVGVKDAQGREYLGARGARFAIFPGSALAKKPPAWAMVAELVETSRLWGRDAATHRPEVGRAARRAPRVAHLLRAALGGEPRLRSWRRSG